MGITLESIYKPVNDFFLNTFRINKDAPIEFRLQQFATVISEEDFEGINNDEMSSDLVNEIPYIDDNGLNVAFLPNNIDDVYELILSALPFFDESLNHDEKEVIHDSFIRAKTQVDNDWETFSHARSNGIADFFRLTYLSPSNWLNNESKVWEKRKFEIQEPKTVIKAQSNSNLKILKVRMTDTELVKVLPMFKAVKKVKPLEFKMQLFKAAKKMKTLEFKMQPKFLPRQIIAPAINKPKPVRITRDHRTVQKPVLVRRARIHLKSRPIKASNVKRTALGLKFSKAFHGLKFNEKIIVKDFIKEKSPSKAIKTNNVSISFEYCLVNVRRKWFNEVMCIINRLWYIPGIKKGSISDPKIGGLSHLPIAFLAVKNLNISANWDSLDKKQLEKVVSFGPFDINNHNIKEKGSLSHNGIQIIGWMLQKLPELPPN